MSGGSYDYLYHKVEEVADQLDGDRSPLRRAFAEHLHKVAKALHDIEWVDSGDYGPRAGDSRHPCRPRGRGRQGR